MRIRTPLTRADLAWREVEDVSADVRSRYGLRSTTLEVDAGEVLVVFSRRSLGADPADRRGTGARDAPADPAGSEAAGGGPDADRRARREHEQRAEPGELDPIGHGRAPFGSPPIASPASAPVTKPPTWPSCEMPVTENVNTKFSTMTPTSHCRSSPSRRTSTRQAPNSPNSAPDAPTTGTSGEPNA